MIKLVYIASPYAGDIKYNTKMAIEYCRHAISCNVCPIAPHLLFPRFLDENDPAEREQGIKLSLRAMAVFDDR